VRELGNGGWDLETLVQNDLLPLEADVFGPFDETGEVSLGSDILAWVQAEFQEFQGRDDDTNAPIPKFLALASNKGFFFTLVVLLAPKGAAAGFFRVPDLALGWSLRRSERFYPFSSREKEKMIALRSSNAVRTPTRRVGVGNGPAKCFTAQRAEELSRERVSTTFHAVLLGKGCLFAKRRHPLQKRVLTIHPKFSLIQHKMCNRELKLVVLLRAGLRYHFDRVFLWKARSRVLMDGAFFVFELRL
jgi:hypothetical protein